MKVLFVLTSHDALGDTGEKTGFWLEEFAAPYYYLKDAGVEVTIASPAGGQPPLDPKSAAPDAQTEATRRFKNDKDAQQALANTARLNQRPGRDRFQQLGRSWRGTHRRGALPARRRTQATRRPLPESRQLGAARRGRWPADHRTESGVVGTRCGRTAETIVAI